MKNKYTHKGWMYLFIPVYVNEDTSEVAGRNWLTDKMLDLFFYLDIFSEGFSIIITGEL